MTEYEKYEEVMYKLMYPSPLPDDLALSYACSLKLPIAEVSLDAEANGGDGELRMRFDGGGTLAIWDGGRSCCESRYLTTDDELESYVGARLQSFDISGVESTDDEDGDPHETVFVRLHTDAGTITLVTHNEHNGYYGGLDINAYYRSNT